MLTKPFQIACTIVFFICLTFPVLGDEFKDEFSWNVTLEAGFVFDPTLLDGAKQDDFGDYTAIDIWIDLYYKGFFVQTNRYRSSGNFGATELGYELHLGEDYEINLISKSYLAGFDSRNVGQINDEFIPELVGIKQRQFAPSQGVRYMRYLHDSVLWVDVAVDLIAGYHRGWVLDTFYTRTLEYRNLDFSLGAGVTAFSADMTNYYFGVDADEVISELGQDLVPIRPFYEPGFGYRAELEAIIRYPLAQDWLFTAGATLSHYSDSISDSPLVARANVFRFKLSVSYVF